MVSIKIYVEGGGDRKDLKTRCRQGFSKFFEKAGFKNAILAKDAASSFMGWTPAAMPPSLPAKLMTAVMPTDAG